VDWKGLSPWAPRYCPRDEVLFPLLRAFNLGSMRAISFCGINNCRTVSRVI
jgi:hypothetical protein